MKDTLRRAGANARVAGLLAASLAIAPVGCRRFEPVSLSPTDTAAALENRSLADPQLRAFFERAVPGSVSQWPRATWDLDGLTLAALYYQPSVKVARAQWQVAEAGVLTAGTSPNPSVSVTPQYVANSPSGMSPWVVVSALDWPIETAGKRGRRIDKAEHVAASARLALDTAAWKVRADVRARLLDVVAAREHAALAARDRQAHHEIVALLEQRQQLGAVSVADVTLARVAELQAVAALGEAERQHGEARVRLATAVGVPVRALDGLDLVLPIDGRAPELDRPSDDLRRDALLNRPDVLAALADYAASQSALQLEIARQYPDLRIGPGYEYDQGLNKWAVVGISVELPVLNRNQGPIGEAEARRTEAAARFTALQASIIDELDRALANRTAARDALDRADALLAAEQRRHRSTMQAFDAGAIDRLALLGAEVTAIQAEQIQFDAQVRRQQAVGDLEAAVQPPLDVDPMLVEGRNS
jgi:cobalt-zinc-cadmium efflux system outer membrane protein